MGPMGPMGPKGPMGAMGPTGPMGRKGPHGAHGAHGPGPGALQPSQSWVLYFLYFAASVTCFLSVRADGHLKSHGRIQMGIEPYLLQTPSRDYL